MRRLSFVLSRECSLGAHGLLRFRTNDVLLGTSGVGVCDLWCLIPSVCYIGFPNRDLLFNSSVSCWKPSRWRGRGPQFETWSTLILFVHTWSGLNFAQVTGAPTRIRTRVLTLSALWCVFVFRHGRFVWLVEGAVQSEGVHPMASRARATIVARKNKRSTIRDPWGRETGARVLLV